MLEPDMKAMWAVEAHLITKPEPTVVYAFKANDAIDSWFEHFGPCGVVSFGKALAIAGNDYRDDGVEAWLVDHIQDCHLHRLQENWSDDLMVMPSREKAQQLLKVMIVAAMDATKQAALEKL
tara:strand:+ start:31 stop:396 length:366 start_codon:yes stop_codon:yes gene_type:complete